jgi:hypothetical protein
VEAVHRRDDRKAWTAARVCHPFDLCGRGRLARPRRPGDPEQETAGRAVDGGEQSLGEGFAYSLLDAAQRLIPLSVA